MATPSLPYGNINQDAGKALENGAGIIERLGEVRKIR